MYNYCKNCKGKIVLHAFSNGTCEICECDIFCAHTPSDKVCMDCSEELNICESCGDKL